jgi:hypothetical protein
LSKGSDINVSQFLPQSPLDVPTPTPTTSIDIGQQVVSAAQVLLSTEELEET